MPDNVLKRLFAYLIPENKKVEFRISMISAITTAFFSYFMLMVTGYAGPDAIIEGVHQYTGFGWALALGRWFLAYVQRHVVGNAVIPFLIVIMYAVLVGLSAIALFRMFNITNKAAYVLIPALFVSFPIVLQQFGFLYMAAFYSYSFFATVMSILCIRQRKIWGYVIGIICLLTMLGSYQSYIGSVAALAVMLFVIDLIDGRKKRDAFLDFGATALAGVIASALDLVCINVTMTKENIAAADRVSSVSLQDILGNIHFSFVYAFKWFFTYFEDSLFSRDKMYLLLLLVIVVCALICVINLIIAKKYLEAFLTLFGVYLVPHAMNMSQYMFPHNGINGIMRYHYVLIFVFAIALINRCDIKIAKCITQWLAYVSMFALLNTYILSDNIGGLQYKITYNQNYTEASAMINRVYELKGYKQNETRVVLAKPIDWTILNTEYGLLFTETVIGAGPVYWDGFFGLNVCRRNYFMAYLGVEVGYISEDEYNSVVNSLEYQKMPVWPAEGSVKMINGFAVIKNE